MKRSYGVFFDMNTNQYIRLNKQTGEQRVSYKNGSNLRTFKPQITGMSYHTRKISDFSLNKTISYQKKSPLKKIQIKNLNTIDRQQQSKQRVRIQKAHKLDKILQSSLNRTQSNSPKASFFYSSIPSTINNEDNVSKQKNIFATTLRKFTQINTSKFNQNQSPRKDTIPGSSPSKDLLSHPCVTLSSFKDKQIFENAFDNVKKMEVKPIRKMNLEYPYQIQIKNQLKRQNQQFLQFHPEYTIRQDEEGKKKLLDRKTNIKKLQRLFISNNNRITNSIYQSN